MKRSTWLAVLVTAAVLVVAGNLPRLPVSEIAAWWRAGVARQVAAWPHLGRRVPPGAQASPVAGPLPQPVAQRQARRALITVAPTRLLATREMPRAAMGGFAPASRLAMPPYLALPALAGGLAALLALAALGLGARRDPRGRVWRLARRGLTLARIARTARVPQDAVRSLLTPGLGARR